MGNLIEKVPEDISCNFDNIFDKIKVKANMKIIQ